MKRAGFTMIELIFVIVILGILAAVAVPKLAATRADAEQSALLSDIRTCVGDAGSHWTAAGSFTTFSSTACTNVSADVAQAITDNNGSIDINGTTYNFAQTAVVR